MAVGALRAGFGRPARFSPCMLFIEPISGLGETPNSGCSALIPLATCSICLAAGGDRDREPEQGGDRCADALGRFVAGSVGLADSLQQRDRQVQILAAAGPTDPEAAQGIEQAAEGGIEGGRGHASPSGHGTGAPRSALARWRAGAHERVPVYRRHRRVLSRRSLSGTVRQGRAGWPLALRLGTQALPACSFQWEHHA